MMNCIASIIKVQRFWVWGCSVIRRSLKEWAVQKCLSRSRVSMWKLDKLLEYVVFGFGPIRTLQCGFRETIPKVVNKRDVYEDLRGHVAGFEKAREKQGFMNARVPSTAQLGRLWALQGVYSVLSKYKILHELRKAAEHGCTAPSELHYSDQSGPKDSTETFSTWACVFIYAHVVRELWRKLDISIGDSEISRKIPK